MRKTIPYILAAFLCIGIGSPANGESPAPQHVSGGTESNPNTYVHISGVRVPRSTISHISGVAVPAPETAPKINFSPPDKASASERQTPEGKAAPKISRKKVLEMARVDDRANRKKLCWKACEKNWKTAQDNECSSKLDEEAQSCRKKLFETRLTCIREQCSHIP